MPYSPTTWADTPATSSPISAANLNKIETELARLKVNADLDPAAAIAYSKLALALSIVNGDVSASAAIAYSKLNLASSIVNADVASAAAIALSKLADPGSGNVVTSTGSGAVAVKPPGYEYAYTENTGTVNVTATTSGTAQSLVVASSVTFDGATLVNIEFFAADVQPDTVAAGRRIIIGLWDSGTFLGPLGYLYSQAAGVSEVVSMVGRRRLTPSAAAHVYEARAFVSAGTAIVAGGAGTGGADMPFFIRITKA